MLPALSVLAPDKKNLFHFCGVLFQTDTGGSDELAPTHPFPHTFCNCRLRTLYALPRRAQSLRRDSFLRMCSLTPRALELHLTADTDTSSQGSPQEPQPSHKRLCTKLLHIFHVIFSRLAFGIWVSRSRVFSQLKIFKLHIFTALPTAASATHPAVMLCCC